MPSGLRTSILSAGASTAACTLVNLCCLLENAGYIAIGRLFIGRWPELSDLAT